MKKLFAKVVAAITGGKAVWLFDFDYELNVSVAYRRPDGILEAHRFWPVIGSTAPKCLLLEGGSVCGPSYVKSWKYVE